MIYRIKQIFNYISPPIKDFENIKKFLSKKEFEIFLNMSDYDKKHSFYLFKDINKNYFGEKKDFLLKAALLHDCGKDKNLNLFDRILHTIKKNKKIINHSEKSYEILLNENKEIADFVRHHHFKTNDDLMKVFQKFDDRN